MTESESETEPGPGRTSVQTLGGFRVVVNGTEIVRWRAGRARQLFQFLLTQAGTPAPKATLIDAVWGDAAARSPEISLKVAVYNLRNVMNDAQRLGAAGAPAGPPGLWITLQGSGYALTVDGARIDVLDFERALNAGVRAVKDGRPAEAAREYRRAVDLYTGSYLPECQDAWAMIRREQLKDRLLGALAELTDQARRAQDSTTVVELHQRMLDIDPCREESYRELMRWHAAANQPSRVMHWYMTCGAQLRERLGVEPDSRTRQVYYEAVSGQLS